jgi:hypothetical protein
LPEPLLTASDVAADVELANSVSMAMLLVLETLTPTERAVFVRRECSIWPTTSSPKPSTRARPRSARSATGHGHTSPHADHAGSFLRLNGELDGVLAVRIDDGLVTGLYHVRNPEKLSRVERETAVSR